MKKTKSLIGILILLVTLATSCSAKKAATQSSNSNKSGNPFGETYEAPCTVYDTNQEFTATGMFRGSKNQMNVVQTRALQNAQQLVRLKVKHAYKGLVSEYSSSIGNNKGNDVEDKMEMACDKALDGILNDTKAECTRWGAVDEDGHLYCYMAIRISKRDLAEKATKEVKNLLTEDEKDRIRFNEMNFRNEMNKRFEEFKEGKQ
ncbi:MAG: hypothetical protein IJR06_05285 [Paludibacteraceae bacterium]|nr:hypothetical protein [Paludibacteraceae bacterium]